ncbi:MAG: tryptophan 2,3-dioxygenase [Phycisphaerales bacterium]
MPPLTYSTYLKIDELLELQQPRSKPAEHDETLFIIIHQVYELWFKQILHEIRFLQRALEANDPPTALHGFKRVLTILKTLVAQVDVLETMTPLSFNSFRDYLESGSGFQSAQFRELEFALGIRNPKMIRHHANTPAAERLEALADSPTLYDSFLRFLSQNGHDIPDSILHRDFSERYEPSEKVQDAIIEIYRHHPIHAQICERLVDLDEGLQEWRYRHVKMVERTIGTKPGTGGSPGAEYLKTTLFRPVFPDLWAVRTRF